MCLQIDSTNEVVLDSCITAISRFDFNDVWRYNNKRQIYNPISNMCMTLEDNVETDGGSIRMLPCKNENGEDYSDGRNSWTFTSNNQMRLRRPGNLCLSQKGSSAGMANVALNKIAKSNFSIMNMEENAAEKALDGNAKSFWASRKFKVNEQRVVDFIVDLQDSYKLQTLKIVWQYPALSYNIFTRVDETEWALAKNVGANTLKTTIDYLNDKLVQYIKIQLTAPNPDFGDIEGFVQYGIANISAYTNRLKTIVEPCDTAKNSKDARDKYFLESVYQVDLSKTLPLRRAEARIEEIVNTIEGKISDLEKLTAKISKCKNRHESYFNKVEQLKRVYRSSLEKLSQVDVHLSSVKPAVSDEREFSDCIYIKNLGENKPSGFYDILPQCYNQKLRVYCDMYTGSSYYVSTVEDDTLIGLSNVIDECSKYGLHPFHLQHEKQLESLSVMLKTMEVPPGTIIPVAVKVGDSLRSLDLAADVSKYVSLENLKDGNILGVTPEGVELFDGRDKDMSGIICSTNFSSVRPPEKIPTLACNSRITDNSDLPTKPGSKFNVKCPQNCHETYENYEVEGGKDGLYSFNSSVCLSAVHAGEYDNKSGLQVEIVSSPGELDGFFQNGINSASVSTTLGESAFKVKRMENKCKFKKGKKVIKHFKMKLASNALNRNNINNAVKINTPKETDKENKETNDKNKDENKEKEENKDNVETKEKEKAENDKKPTLDSSKITNKGDNQEEDKSEDLEETENKLDEVPPIIEVNKPKKSKHYHLMPSEMSTGEAIHSLVTHIYSQNTKGSPVFLNLFRDHTGLILANTRDLIKKADLKKIPGQSMFVNLDHRVEHMGSAIKLIASQLSYKRQMMAQKINKLMREKNLHSSFESFSLLKTSQESLFSIFTVETTSATKGYPTWVMSELNVKNSTELTISQMSQIIPPNNTIAGSYLVLKDKKFYDFIFSASVYAGSTGSLGLAFRMVDMNNYYLLQMKQSNGGFKRLIRVIDGEPYELARVEDGGYIEEVWYHVRIETRQSRLMISVVQGEDEIFDTPNAVIDVIDATHSSGTVALYTGKVSFAHFKRFNVEALSCLRYDSPPIPPEPPFCSIFKEDFLSNFSHNWSVYNSKGEWRFEKDLMGEPNVIANTLSLGVQEETDPTISVLKNHKSCTYGIFSASILMQCDFGTAGLVFRFHNAGEFLLLEISPKYSALKQMNQGTLTTITETNLRGVSLNEWTSLSVTFNDDLVTVSMGGSVGSDLIFLNVRTAHELKPGGSVGLASLNCSGVAFSNISLKPIYKHNQGLITDAGSKLDNEGVREEGTKKCLEVDRRSECGKISPENLEACEHNFCSFCCQTHYMDKDAQSVCEEQCSKQDEKVSMIQKYLDQLWFNCSGSGFIEKHCKDKDCKGKLIYLLNFVARVCGMCCHSFKPQEDLSKNLTQIAKDKCNKLCSSL
uniref:LCCL domain-containing protein n=1 Tax=Theileria parva TaxID=5875 RepID=Q4N2Y3_THEPA|eukprot:XP_763844.1 hypothetical protein [Theileria parva strain Muguga]